MKKINKHINPAQVFPLPDAYKHCAYCTLTGEIIEAPTGTGLKRAVKKMQRHNARYGFPTGGWVFSHNYYITRRGY